MISLYLIFTTNLHIYPLSDITGAVTRNTLKMILRQQVICIVSQNTERYLSNLKSCIIYHGLPEEAPVYAIANQTLLTFLQKSR